MRVSEYFGLNRKQPSLDFVDVDVYSDSRLFVDPRALRVLDNDWSNHCVLLVQDFFGHILAAIQTGKHEEARRLLSVLREPNETHLGLSRGKSQGHALGNESARDVWESLSKSEAVSSGLIEDLEDTVLLVAGISSDIVSDMTTNIMREPLIKYTQEVCAYYGVPVTRDIDSGPLWDPDSRCWFNEFTPMPMTEYGKLLLVPKAIVRKRLEYDEDEYFRHYILEFLKQEEIRAGTELVRLLKDGSPRVFKKDLKLKYGRGKSVGTRITLEHPGILEQFRRDHVRPTRRPLDHRELADYEIDQAPDWDALMSEVRVVSKGRPEAAEYEDAIEQLLTALFYPNLTNPKVQHEIHGGRKRIDIAYTNSAAYGFFAWLAAHYNAPYIYVECKNYSADPGNPELDQLIGRFSDRRGRVGLLICRSIEDKDLFEQRCRDTTDDGNGFILALDDTDLQMLVQERIDYAYEPRQELLRAKFDRLVM